MTQEEKRIKLAKADGIKHGVKCSYTDYFNNLNAVHKLEKVLTKPQQNKFILELDVIIRGDGDYFDIAHANAAQRAEALGLTLNLW